MRFISLGFGLFYMVLMYFAPWRSLCFCSIYFSLHCFASFLFVWFARLRLLCFAHFDFVSQFLGCFLFCPESSFSLQFATLRFIIQLLSDLLCIALIIVLFALFWSVVLYFALCGSTKLVLPVLLLSLVLLFLGFLHLAFFVISLGLSATFTVSMCFAPPLCAFSPIASAKGYQRREEVDPVPTRSGIPPMSQCPSLVSRCPIVRQSAVTVSWSHVLVSQSGVPCPSSMPDLKSRQCPSVLAWRPGVPIWCPGVMVWCPGISRFPAWFGVASVSSVLVWCHGVSVSCPGVVVSCPGVPHWCPSVLVPRYIWGCAAVPVSRSGVQMSRSGVLVSRGLMWCPSSVLSPRQILGCASVPVSRSVSWFPVSWFGVPVCVCVYVFARACGRVCLRMCMHMPVYVYVYVCMVTCTCAYVNVHLHVMVHEHVPRTHPGKPKTGS